MEPQIPGNSAKNLIITRQVYQIIQVVNLVSEYRPMMIDVTRQQFINSIYIWIIKRMFRLKPFLAKTN